MKPMSEELQKVRDRFLDRLYETGNLHSNTNYIMSKAFKDGFNQCFESMQKTHVPIEKVQKLVEALECISTDGVYVGENGWRDEYFLSVKQAKEALREFREGKE